MTLDDRIERYLATIPPAISGQDGHGQTFKVTCRLVNGFALSPGQALHWLRVYNTKCDPSWSEAELLHKVESAFAADHREPRGHLLGEDNGAAAMWQEWEGTPVSMAAAPKWPQPDVVMMIEEICREGISLATLHADSPAKIDGHARQTEEVIDAMFPGDPWLCCGAANHDFSTRLRSEWRGSLANQSLIVPSAMLGRYGFTKHGKVSEHAQSAVGPRQYLVVEFDFALKSRDGLHDTELAPLIRRLDAYDIKIAGMCSALLAHLARFVPLALVVHSGGKSLHGWFP